MKIFFNLRLGTKILNHDSSDDLFGLVCRTAKPEVKKCFENYSKMAVYNLYTVSKHLLLKFFTGSRFTEQLFTTVLY